MDTRQSLILAFIVLIVCGAGSMIGSALIADRAQACPTVEFMLEEPVRGLNVLKNTSDEVMAIGGSLPIGCSLVSMVQCPVEEVVSEEEVGE